jgi:Methyltransferase domain
MRYGRSMLKQLKIKGKNLARRWVPLALRKKACVLMERRKWFSPDTRYWLIQEFLRDFEASDRDAFHRFLWSHHLGYALSYEVNKRFGVENMVGSRKLFFSELHGFLGQMGLPPARVRSVFEVGCSLGYQLRYLETDLLPQAEILEGIDIDSKAIHQGGAFLAKAGSKVKLSRIDMADLSRILSGKHYDLILCTGVLMYLQEREASRIVKAMMGHSRIAAFSGLANLVSDNSQMETSEIRDRDGTFIHNLDAMVKNAGGEVIYRRWDGGDTIEGQTIYFVFARPNP